VNARPVAVTDEGIRAKLGAARFFSATTRLFKLDGLEPQCEDHGQAVIYRGDIPHAPEAFMLDGHHRIETGKVFPVCGNTWRMLADTRLAPHFQFIGDFSRHYGVFEGCGLSLPQGAIESAGGDAAACC
jgi:arsenite methyltransferase